MHVRFVVNILGTKNCTQSALKPHNKSPETRINAGFPSSIFLFKLLGEEIYLAVSLYTFVRFILHIYLILHFCVPRLKFLEPKWSQKHS